MFNNRALRMQIVKTDKDDVGQVSGVDLKELDEFIARNGKRFVAGVAIIYGVIVSFNTASKVVVIKTMKDVEP